MGRQGGGAWPLSPDPPFLELREAPDPAAMPPAIVLIRDDDAAREFARRVGSLDDLRDDDSPKTSILALLWKHPTHWIACGRFQNYPDPDDNGYAVLAVPRWFWPKEKFLAVAGQYFGPDPGKIRGMVNRYD